MKFKILKKSNTPLEAAAGAVYSGFWDHTQYMVLPLTPSGSEYLELLVPAFPSCELSFLRSCTI